ncbi:MAG: M23 family metallopeptidase [Candidatus Uhrbacteria bacterium]
MSVLRSFVFIKQNVWSITKVTFKPLIIFSHFLFRQIGLPGYRLVFFLKRQLLRVYSPTKNKFIFLFANRLILHAVVVSIITLTSVISVQASEVRGESYGSQSLFISIVSPDESNSLEEVLATEAALNLSASTYSDSFVVSSETFEEESYSEENEMPIAAIFGGSTLVAPTITKPQASVAKRTETENYIVQEGDVLGSIAEKFSLKLNTLLWANNLTYRSTIKPGQELVILPADGITYKIKNGDTISSIIKKYGSSEDKILAFNNLASASDLKIGETLVLPDAEPLKTATVQYAAPVTKIFTGGSSAPAAATGSWVWPTDGCYITVYFNQWYLYGLHKGLDVDGDYSSNIYATRGGTVTRSGWFDGYGNSIDINHGDGYVTRYGHASKLFVSAGDTVSAGEVIAKVGTTGKSTGTHLHFEVMNDGTKVNPLNFIRCK